MNWVKRAVLVIAISFLIKSILEWYEGSLTLFQQSNGLTKHQHQQQQTSKIQKVALAKGIENSNNNTNTTTSTRQEGEGDSKEEHNNQLAREVESIHHLPDRRQIIVNLRNEQRNCRSPKLFGRLSGPYVTLIQWEPTTTDDNQIIGSYFLPSSGRYFIEVIGLFCNGPQWNASFQNVCMEDPTMHRITEDTASIDVVIQDDDDNNNITASSLGYWKWSPPENETTTTIQPLLTRYQPQQCRSETELESDRCQPFMSRERFAPYQFHNKEEEGRIRSRIRQLQQPILLCFIGLSHAREMNREVNLWLEQWNVTSEVVRSISIDAQFPYLVNPIRIKRQKCSMSVIAAGQWSAGRKPPMGKYRGMPPTTFDEYRTEMQDMVIRLREQRLDLSNIYLRSIHYNALGDLKTTCPPTDWRSPPVIDTYNEIIRNLTLSMNVSYIDTNFIIGPLWDISLDFCHYRMDKVASAEALYMLGRLLLPR